MFESNQFNLRLFKIIISFLVNFEQCFRKWRKLVKHNASFVKRRESSKIKETEASFIQRLINPNKADLIPKEIISKHSSKNNRVLFLQHAHYLIWILNPKNETKEICSCFKNWSWNYIFHELSQHWTVE